MALRDTLDEIKRLHPVSAALFFAPTVVFFVLSIAQDYLCAWALRDPYSIIWWSLGAVAVTSALVEIDRSSTDRLVGRENPPMGTRFLSLMFLSVNINGIVTVVVLLPYALLKIFLAPRC